MNLKSKDLAEIPAEALAKLAVQFASIEEGIGSINTREHLLAIVGDVFNTLALSYLESDEANMVMSMKINLVSIAIANDFDVIKMLSDAGRLSKMFDEELNRRYKDASA